MIFLMLVGVGVVAVILLYVLLHKRPVVNNVGLDDPSTWQRLSAPLPATVPWEQAQQLPPPAPAQPDQHSQQL